MGEETADEKSAKTKEDTKINDLKQRLHKEKKIADGMITARLLIEPLAQHGRQHQLRVAGTLEQRAAAGTSAAAAETNEPTRGNPIENEEATRAKVADAMVVQAAKALAAAENEEGTDATMVAAAMVVQADAALEAADSAMYLRRQPVRGRAISHLFWGDKSEVT